MAKELVYGKHAVAALLEHDPAGVRELWLVAGRRDGPGGRAKALAARHGIHVHTVPRATLDRMLQGARHQGIAANYRATRPVAAPDLEGVLDALGDTALLLVLDGVQDPHNLGAILRSADAAGADAVIVPRRGAVGLTPAVRKAASGAAERVCLVGVANLAQALRRMRDAGVFLYAAEAGAGIAYGEADLRARVALILGGEGRGLRRLSRELCDQLIHVPVEAGAASLNVSVAAALCLFEARRQRSGTPRRGGG